MTNESIAKEIVSRFRARHALLEFRRPHSTAKTSERSGSSLTDDHSDKPPVAKRPRIESQSSTEKSDFLQKYAVASYRPPEQPSSLMNASTNAASASEYPSKWRLLRVLAGHDGWVRSIAIDHQNEFIVSGSSDATIKVWDLASGVLRRTLTSHSSAVRTVALSPVHRNYMFSGSDDRSVRLWDLESNKTIRRFHGHNGGCYTCAAHPQLDVLVSAGRDHNVFVWDVRTNEPVMKLVGHRDAVASVSVQATLPQIVSSSFDRTVRLWDLVAGRCVTTLTHHRNAVRANVIHPRENTFAAASADVVNKYAFPDGRFVHPFAVVNARFSWVHAMALGGLAEDVLACGCDDGQVVLSDWRSGNVTEVLRSPPQPGSLASEQSIFSVAFDRSGSRLITGEADKSIKVYGLMT